MLDAFRSYGKPTSILLSGWLATTALLGVTTTARAENPFLPKGGVMATVPNAGGTKYKLQSAPVAGTPVQPAPPQVAPAAEVPVISQNDCWAMFVSLSRTMGARQKVVGKNDVPSIFTATIAKVLAPTDWEPIHQVIINGTAGDIVGGNKPWQIKWFDEHADAITCAGKQRRVPTSEGAASTVALGWQLALDEGKKKISLRDNGFLFVKPAPGVANIDPLPTMPAALQAQAEPPAPRR